LRRVDGFSGGTANTDGMWAKTYRRIADECCETVLIGSSRVVFDFDLSVLAEELGGRHPIQLALEGTTPRPFLRALAEDPQFDGFLIIGVTPGLFFSPRVGIRADVIEYTRNQTPSQRIGQELSEPLERMLSLMDTDAALWTRVGRLPWPIGDGMPPKFAQPHKVMTLRGDRQAGLFWRIERDPAYQQTVRDTSRFFAAIPMPPPAEAEIAALVEEARIGIETIRARGGEVVFVRPPSRNSARARERSKFPRRNTWDVLLERTHSVGIHFEDIEELQGLELPESSHLAVHEKAGFTRAIGRHLRPVYDRWRARADSSVD